MYDQIAYLIDHVWTTGDSAQSTIYYICGALIIILTAVTLDLVYRVFSHFWRSGR